MQNIFIAMSTPLNGGCQQILPLNVRACKINDIGHQFFWEFNTSFQDLSADNRALSRKPCLACLMCLGQDSDSGSRTAVSSWSQVKTVSMHIVIAQG